MAGGWGGARVGAGRKPKDKAAARLHGSRQRTVIRFPGAEAPPPEPAEPIDPPKKLSPKARAVWRELAPYAQAAGTLTTGTAAAFALLCRAVVLEQRLSRGLAAGSADHRGMMQRVEVGMTRFGLAPIGKPIAAPAKPEDPFAEFDKAPAAGGPS